MGGHCWVSTIGMGWLWGVVGPLRHIWARVVVLSRSWIVANVVACVRERWHSMLGFCLTFTLDILRR